MTMHPLTAKRGLILASLAFVTASSFAYPSYKEPAPMAPPLETSLQGWDGNIPACSDKNPAACWNRAYYDEIKIWSPVVSLGGGVVITSKVGQSRYFGIEDPVTDEFYSYNAQEPSQSGAFFEIFLGTEWAFHPGLALQMGVDFDQVYTNYYANGTFTQGADRGSADQYAYSYNATTRQVLAESKLLFSFQHQFHPYFLLGLGAAFNNAYGYKTSVPPFLTFTRQFSDNTNASFSYAVGLGIDLDVSQEIRLGLGYRFTDLGRVALGSASINGISVPGTLSQSDMYANLVLAQLTFIF